MMYVSWLLDPASITIASYLRLIQKQNGHPGPEQANFDWSGVLYIVANCPGMAGTFGIFMFVILIGQVIGVLYIVANCPRNGQDT